MTIMIVMKKGCRMFYQENKLSLQSPLRPLSVLVFHLFLTHSSRGDSQVIGPRQSVVAGVGEDIILPCHLKPAMDLTKETIEWRRSDLELGLVHVWRAGQDLEYVKNPSYSRRTSLFTDELKRGNFSLKLSNVQLTDQATYECDIPLQRKQSSVKLVVASGAVPSPVISLFGIDRKRAGVILHCESRSWYPEPEVLWLDGEGNLLSAGPTETVRGPDDLYTVSSRVTVEKRHSNSFTCRVQQKDTNHTREADITVPDDFFEVQSGTAPIVIVLAVSLAVYILFSLLLFIFIWKWRHKKSSFHIETKSSHSDGSEKGEKNNCSEANRREDQLTEEEREKQQLVAAESVQMQVFKEEGEENTAHSEDKLSAASDLSPVTEENHWKEERVNKVEIPDKLEANQAAPAQSSWSSWFQSDSKSEFLKKEVDKLSAENKKLQEELKKLKDLGEETNMKWKKNIDELYEAKVQIKEKDEEINQLKRQLEKQLWTDKEKDKKHQAELVNFNDKWQNIVKEKIAKRKNAEKELEDIKTQWQKLLQDEVIKRENLKKAGTKVCATKCEVQESENLTTSQSSATGPVIVDEIGKCGRYIRLRNTSDKAQPLGGWQLHMQVNDRNPIKYTFDKSFKVSSGKTSTISVPGSGSFHNPVDLVWQELKPCSTGDKLKVSLISKTGEIQHQLSS